MFGDMFRGVGGSGSILKGIEREEGDVEGWKNYQ